MDLLFLINPSAGRAFWQGRFIKEMEAACKEAGLQHLFTRTLEESHMGRDTVLVSCGGDGTVSSTINSLLERQVQVPMAIVPIGTGNDIARCLGWYEIWEEWGPWGVITAIKASQCKGMDVWGVSRCGASDTPHTFVGYLGIGMDAAIVKLYQRLARVLWPVTLFAVQKRLYHVVAGAMHLVTCPFRLWRWRSKLRLRNGLDGEFATFPTGIDTCLLFTNIHSYLGGVRLMDSISFDDGRLDLFYWASWWDFITFAIKGHFFRKAMVTSPLDHRGGANSFYFDLEGPAPLQIDGEFMGVLSPGSYEIKLCASVPVLIPPFNLLNPEKTPLKQRWALAKKAEKGLVPEPSFY